MKHNLLSGKEYKAWLSEIKSKVRNAQLKAAVRVNTALLTFYWELGADIVAKQAKAKWGDALLATLSKDLIAEFPEMKGFSLSNLKYIKQWYQFYASENAISQQAVGLIGQQLAVQITQIPWGHNIVIITNCKSIKEATFYVQNTIKYNWSRSVLEHQIESGLYEREGKAINNFALTLPKPQSDLAEQTLKDPYWFDFLTLAKKHNEREIELKTTAFQPEFAGKLNFYLKAIDKQVRAEHDNPTVGIIICKKKDKVVAEYALSDIHKPIGISAYKLTHSLPKKFKPSLPSIEQIEKELSNGGKK